MACLIGGNTFNIDDLLTLSSNNDGVFDATTIRSGLNCFFNRLIVFVINFLSCDLDFFPYG